MSAGKKPGPGTEDSTVPTVGHDATECARAWSLLHAAHTLLCERLEAELDDYCDLALSEFEVLTHLTLAAPRGLRLSDLNHAVALSQPALSRLVARLERRGLVERGDDPGDARVVLVSLTDRGREVARRAMEIHAACVHKVLAARLSAEDLDALVSALSRIRPAG